MYVGPMDGAKGEWDWGWEVGMGRVGKSGGGKMETTVFEQQQQKKKIKKKAFKKRHPDIMCLLTK